MKKIVFCLLACFMTAALTGCGSMAERIVRAAEKTDRDESAVKITEADRTDAGVPDPADEGKFSEEAAYEIACEHWNFREGNTDPDTGYRMTVFREGVTQQGADSFYTFRLSWFVKDHWSALDTVYVNVLTGEKADDSFRPIG